MRIKLNVSKCSCKYDQWDYYCPEHGGESGLFVQAFNSVAKKAHDSANRHGNPPDDKIPEFNGYEVELADCIIRIMDTAVSRGLRVAEAIVAKIAHNEGRPYKHGKQF